MIKKILFSALLFSGILVNAQTFTATYNFAATTTLSGTTDPTTPPAVTGVTCGSFVAVGTPSANANAAGRFSFVGWPTGATTAVDTYSTMTGTINTNEYYEVVLTPQSGYTVAFNTITFTTQRSGTGIRNYVVRTSADGFTNNLPASVTTNTNLSVVGTNEFFWNLDAVTSAQNGSTINLFGATTTSSVSFRFYAWNSEGSGGTFSIDNVAFTGTVSGAATPCASPTITAITGNSAICSNQTLNLGSTVTGDSPFTYTWTGSGTLATPNASATSITNATSSDYTLTVSNACGTATSVVTATVNPAPSVSVNSATICAGESVTLTASGTASSYAWSTTETTSSIVVTPTANTSYTVTGSLGSCSVDAISSVQVNSAPNITVNSATICAGNSATLTATGTSTAFVWSTGETTSSIVVTPTTSPVTFSVDGSNGCATAASAIATVIVNALPSVSVTSAVVCAGSSATLAASGAVSYSWNSGQTTSSIIVTPTASPAVYTVTGTDANNCSNTAVSTVTVNAVPTITAVTSNTLLCAGQTATLSTTTIVGAFPVTYMWSNMATTPDIIVSPTITTVYTITGTDGNGCSNSTSITQNVSSCTGIQTLNTEIVSIYPNPSNGLVTIKTPVLNAQVNVFDINGKNVFSQTTSTFETSLNLSHLSNGVYQLNIVSDNQSINHKIMINK